MKHTYRFLYVALTMVFMVGTITPSHAKRVKGEPKAKYVFYMTGDGMGINEVTGTELYNQATGKGPAQINFMHFPVRTFVNTFSASSLVADRNSYDAISRQLINSDNDYAILYLK